MRQAGTAPATGTTIYCPTSLWCTVIYKPCSVMDTTNTLLRANVRLVLRSDLCRICCAIYVCCMRNLEFRSIRSSGALRASLERFVLISTDRNSNLNASLRRMWHCVRSKEWINGGLRSLRVLCGSPGDQPACPKSVRHRLMMRSFACITYHFCDSNLQPSSITFCYYYCAEEHCVISPCWMKKNDVPKMRQAGTAPATGTTIYCPTSLWCTVIYKPCSVMDTTNSAMPIN